MFRFWKKRINQRGALLLEALISVVILSVSLTLITQALLSNLHAIIRSVKHFTMVVHLENKMDLLVIKSLLHQPIQDDIKTNSTDPYQFSLEQQRVDEGDDASILRETKLTMMAKEGEKKDQISVVTYLPDFSPNQ